MNKAAYIGRFTLPNVFFLAVFVQFHDLGDPYLDMFDFQQWNEVTYPHFVCYFYCNLSFAIEDVLTSSVSGVEIDRRLLSNLFTILDDGNTYF